MFPHLHSLPLSDTLYSCLSVFLLLIFSAGWIYEPMKAKNRNHLPLKPAALVNLVNIWPSPEWWLYKEKSMKIKMKQNYLHFPKNLGSTNTAQKERESRKKKIRESEPTVCFIFHSNITPTIKSDSINDQTTVC